MKEALKQIVLTGGPSCGKTTLIGELQSRGYQVGHEPARSIIEKRQHIPLTSEEWDIRQRLIYEAQIQQETKYDSGLVFLDRSVIDVAAYSNLYLGYLPTEIKHQPYEKIFLLERLPFENDGLRVEAGEEEAQAIHDQIQHEYKIRNFNPLKLPAFKEKTLQESIEKRIEFLLSQI